jgi:hypothetical protein
MLAKFMYKLSVSCGLSQSYANHSIRATGATILTECNNFADAQIMSVAGKSKVKEQLAVIMNMDADEHERLSNIQMTLTVTGNAYFRLLVDISAVC